MNFMEEEVLSFSVEVPGEGCFVSSDIVSCNTTLARHFKEGEIANIWLGL